MTRRWYYEFSCPWECFMTAKTGLQVTIASATLTLGNIKRIMWRMPPQYPDWVLRPWKDHGIWLKRQQKSGLTSYIGCGADGMSCPLSTSSRCFGQNNMQARKLLSNHLSLSGCRKPMGFTNSTVPIANTETKAINAYWLVLFGSAEKNRFLALKS